MPAAHITVSFHGRRCRGPRERPSLEPRAARCRRGVLGGSPARASGIPAEPEGLFLGPRLEQLRATGLQRAFKDYYCIVSPRSSKVWGGESPTRHPGTAALQLPAASLFQLKGFFKPERTELLPQFTESCFFTLQTHRLLCRLQIQPGLVTAA